LSGREALELSIYGEMQHLDQAKQSKLKEIRETPALDAGYRVALVCLAGQLLSTARELKGYANLVLHGLSPEERAEMGGQ